MVTARAADNSRGHNQPYQGRQREQEVLVHQLTIQQLADDQRCQQLAAAERQRPARHLLVLRRTTRRAKRDEWRMRRAARQAQQLRTRREA